MSGRFVLALVLLGALPVAAPAQSPSPSPSAPDLPAERLRRVQQRRQSLERELAALRGQEKSLLGQVERLELEVRVQEAKLREVQLSLQRANAEMDQTLKRAGAFKESLAAARPVLASRARALYKLGELSYVRMLLSVDRPSEFFQGYRFVTALARRDNERVAAYRRDLLALATTQAELARRTQDALSLQAELRKARRALESDRQRKTTLLTQIVEKKELSAAYLGELEEAESKLRLLLEGLGPREVSVPIAVLKGTLPWPVPGRIRIPFGLRKHKHFDTYTIHNGLEIEAPAESPVAAVHEGTVVFADRFRGYGLMVVIDHGGKHHSLYAHLSEVSVAAGEKVAAGQPIGGVGGMGLEGPGLYFEMRLQGKPEDPAEWLKREGHP